MEIEEVGLLANHIFLCVLQNRVAFVANNFPRLGFLIVVLNNFHNFSQKHNANIQKNPGKTPFLALFRDKTSNEMLAGQMRE